MSAETATVPCGLVAKGGQPVPLLGVRVEAEVKDYAARVVLVQRYRNDETQPIEAVYKFPLDEAGRSAPSRPRSTTGVSLGRSRSGRRPSRSTTRQWRPATVPTSSTRSGRTSSP